jgi:mannitol/fructose-specific phosphotransferase system IIA component (Ntr-type)
VDVGAVDSNPADLFFLLIADRNDPGTIVRILGRLARLCDDESVRAGLREVTEPGEVIDLFRRHEEDGAATGGGS